MDVAAIVASVGSFVVSERVIKAKATFLFGLGCTVCYDLFIHSNDAATLRVYRGPGLIAISIIMFAYCLRSWRRNGIACDELIFLPGTAYAVKAENTTIPFRRLPLNLRQIRMSPGGDDFSPSRLGFDEYSNVDNYDEDILRAASETTEDDLIQECSMSPVSVGNSQNPMAVKNMDVFEIEEQEMIPLTVADERKMYSPSNIWKACRRPRSGSRTVGKASEKSEKMADECNDTTDSEDNCSNQQPPQQIKGFLKLFSTTARETNEYAPSGPIVASAGLDLCMPVLLNFHMFMILTHTDGSEKPDIPPQVLPLIFLSILMLRSFFPFKARTRFWKTIRSSISAPFHSVSFRDEIIGEIATSMVRPLQDILFALFYYFASMYNIFSGSPELEATGSKLEKNFILHDVVLPACAVVPLLCRFLQTLRQAYDQQRRWPHLGNAFKYFTASMVIFYGMTHSEEERSVFWIYCFVICLVYQIWWDIVIDWEALRVTPPEEVDPNRSFPLIPRIQLRSERLFKNDRTYWKIIIFNVLFRFTWMLSFIPAYHLDWAGEIKRTLSVDLKTVVGFAVSLTELVRRCCWVILRLELETMKMTDDKYIGNACSAVSSRVQYRCFAPKEYLRCDNSDTPTSQRSNMKWAAYRLMVKRVFFLELFMWFGAFIAVGLWISALV